MPTTLPTRPSARVFLGTGDGESWGYKRPVKVFARIELRRQSSFGTDPREQETTDHRTVVDPIELAVTFDIIGPSGTDLGGGAMGEDGLRAVTDRSIGAESWKRLARLIPWHLNGATAGCDHQTPVYETDRYGRRVPSLSKTAECPVTGYRYGHSWLVRELPADIIADAVALGAVVPPDRTDPAVIMAEGATDGR